MSEKNLTQVASDHPSYSRFLSILFAGALLIGMALVPPASWGIVEGQNLRSFTLRQIDLLIDQVNSGEPFGRRSENVVEKIRENLGTLSTYLQGPIKKQEFAKVTERLNNAVDDWDNAQMTDARVGLLKARALLTSFAF